MAAKTADLDGAAIKKNIFSGNFDLPKTDPLNQIITGIAPI